MREREGRERGGGGGGEIIVNEIMEKNRYE